MTHPADAETTTGATATKPGPGTTTYHVLREVKVPGDTVSYDPVAANVEAASGAAAIRSLTPPYTETPSITEAGTYVAIPSRSFVPTKVTLSQQTVVTLG